MAKFAVNSAMNSIFPSSQSSSNNSFPLSFHIPLDTQHIFHIGSLSSSSLSSSSLSSASSTYSSSSSPSSMSMNGYYEKIDHPLDITTEAIRNAAHEASIIDGVIPAQYSHSEVINHPSPNLRRGKWTIEEEAYVTRLIEEFRAGTLPIPNGITLRTFLSKLLNCDPMRISKKFVGINSIGKQVYRRMVYVLDETQVKRTREELAELERNFLTRIQNLSADQQDINWKSTSSNEEVVEPCHSMHHSGSTNHVSSYQPFNSGSNHHYSPYTSDGVAFTGVSIDYTLDPQIISQINYNSLNRGEDVDWYRFFEEMKQLQKKSSKNVSETPSTTSNSQANPQKIMTKLTGYKIPIVHLNPVRSFLSSTLEPSNKKRKYLLPDESSESQSTRNNSGSTNDEVDILDEFVTSYLNSKPIGM